MAITIATLEDRTLRRVNEANNSAAGQLDSGTNSTPTITTSDSYLNWYNYISAQVARTCYPIAGRATYANFPANTRSVLLTDLTPVSGGELWAVQDVYYGSSRLAFVHYEVLRLYFSDVDNPTSGTPLYWTKQGDDSIAIYPPPSGSSTTLTAIGFAVPAVATNSGSDQTTWIHDEGLPMLERGTGKEFCEKNLDDTNLAERYTVLSAEYDADRMLYWGRMDRGIREVFYPLPPVPSLMPEIAAQMGMRKAR